jgi:hypothetical protein
LQQQALQQLGCGSGKALMYAAGHVLRPMMSMVVLTLAVNACQGLVERWAQHLPDLDQPQEMQQLAEALAKAKEGDSPPCSAHLLPCISLLCLVPAAALE